MQKLSNPSARQLLNSPSHSTLKQFYKYGTNTTIHTSCSSIESVDDQWRRTAIKWLLEFDRKVTKDTNYLAVWYLQLIQRNGLTLTQSNWQLISGAIIMFASKMNEIYPPSVSSVLKRCKPSAQQLSKQSLIDMQGRLLNMLEFDVAVQSPFNWICQLLLENRKDIEECQKLLKIIIYNREIFQNQSDILAYAIIYLIARNKVDSQLKGQFRTKVKNVAQKIYDYYKEAKRNHQNSQKNKLTKENRNSATKFVDSNNFQENNIRNTNAYGSVGSYIKTDQFSIKKAQDNYFTLTRANSYKFIPKQKPFTETTNLIDKQKKLYHCLSKDDLKSSYKNFFIHS